MNKGNKSWSFAFVLAIIIAGLYILSEPRVPEDLKFVEIGKTEVSDVERIIGQKMIEYKTRYIRRYWRNIGDDEFYYSSVVSVEVVVWNSWHGKSDSDNIIKQISVQKYSKIELLYYKVESYIESKFR